MISEIIAFLIMLNPFALFLYLTPIRKNLSKEAFTKVILKASIISFFICFFFFFVGSYLFESVFKIHFDSFRIFGGIIIFSIAYLFIIRGEEAMIMMREDLDELASKIALPFMVGAGTISLSILLGQTNSDLMGTISLIIIFSINFFIIFSLKTFRDSIEKKKIKILFDKQMGNLLRLNGFFIGAIGIDMVLDGIKNLFHLA
jgi:multiple antibiotic resistance protein